MRKVITIGTSAGGVDALATIVAALPRDLDAAVLITMHVGQHYSVLPALLSRQAKLPVQHATHGEVLRRGVVLVAPPDQHLMVARVGATPTVHLSRGPKENHSRPAIDPLFRSAAEHLRDKVIGVVLTGYLDDGSAGLHAIKQCGGMAIVQDPEEAYAPDMPRNALRTTQVDQTLPLAAIGPRLAELAKPGNGGLPGGGAHGQVPGWLTMENNYFHQASSMHELQEHASPSNFTCPDCGGALFQLNGQPYPRYRCHTGHAHSMAALLRQQNDTIESALWMAVRALQEKEKLAEQLSRKAATDGDAGTAANYASLAASAGSDARMLRDLATHAAGTLAPGSRVTAESDK